MNTSLDIISKGCPVDEWLGKSEGMSAENKLNRRNLGQSPEEHPK